MFKVYWPGQSTVMCERHCKGALRLANAMGFDLDFSVAVSESVCVNCVNEENRAREKYEKKRKGGEVNDKES